MSPANMSARYGTVGPLGIGTSELPLVVVGGQDGDVRVTYDRSVDAAYIYLSDSDSLSDCVTVPCGTPGGEPGVEAMINLDFQDGKIVGLEVIGASRWLPAELLAEAT